MSDQYEVVINGGASSIKRSSNQPLCDFDPEHGFSINESQVKALRWYDQEDHEAQTGDES